MGMRCDGGPGKRQPRLSISTVRQSIERCERIITIHLSPEGILDALLAGLRAAQGNTEVSPFSLPVRPSASCHGEADDAYGLHGPVNVAVGERQCFKASLKRVLAAVPLCAALVIGIVPLGSAMANEPESGKVQEDFTAPVTSITDFSDIPDPLDTNDSKYWAYGSLDELVEAYQCVAGYKQSENEHTFRDDQKATRFEVATFLKSCLDNSIQKSMISNNIQKIREQLNK